MQFTPAPSETGNKEDIERMVDYIEDLGRENELYLNEKRHQIKRLIDRLAESDNNLNDFNFHSVCLYENITALVNLCRPRMYVRQQQIK